MSKLRVGTLSRESYDFVRGNLDALWDCAKLILPLVLLFQLVGVVSAYYEYGFLTLLMAFFVVFINGFFVLSWHRVSLMGPQHRLRYNRDALGRSEWVFLGVFILLAFVFPVLIGAFAGGGIAGLDVMLKKFMVPKPIVLLLAVVILCVVFYLFLLLLRASFVLPARSVGVPLTWKEARRSSKGAIWPLIASSFIFSLLFLVIVLTYAFTSGIVAGVALKDVVTEKNLTYILVKFVMEIPIKFAEFGLMALLITCLSKAYQWGIQNNPIERADDAV